MGGRAQGASSGRHPGPPNAAPARAAGIPRPAPVGRWGRQGTAAAAAGLAGLVLIGSSAANPQEEQPGPDLRLDFSSGLLVSDNVEGLREPEGTSTLWQNSVALSFDSITRTESFSARAGLMLQTGRYADQIEQRELEQNALQDPFVTLSYGRSTRDAGVDLSASYRERDNGLEEVDLIDAQSLVIDQGRRSDLELEAGVEIGREAPLGFSAEAGYRERRFFDTTDPGLTDEDIARIEAGVSVRLSPTMRLTFASSYAERDEHDPEDTIETNTANRVGLSFRNRGGLSGSASIGYQADETTRTIDGDRVTDREDEPVLSFSLTQARPDGSITASLSQRVVSTGPRTDLLVGRSLDLPRAELSASLGVSVGDEGDSVSGIGQLSYVQPLPRGRLSASARQSVATDDGDDELFTSASLGYSHDLSRLSSVDLSLGVSAVESLEEDGIDRQRVSASVSWNRQLTEDWSFNMGYRHSTQRETDEDPIIENAVFANFGRSFDIRP